MNDKQNYAAAQTIFFLCGGLLVFWMMPSNWLLGCLLIVMSILSAIWGFADGSNFTRK